MATDTKVYKKHYSFNTFVSSLNVDISGQRSRVLDYLDTLDRSGISDQKSEIIDNIIRDLTVPEGVEADFKMTTYIADELSKTDDRHLLRYMVNRYRYDVYPKRKILDAYPPYLQIEPSSICNYRCVFCYQVDQEFTKKANGHMGTMTFDMFKEIIDQAENNIEFMSLASRGEPLICKDIDRMLEYCVGKFLGLKINTNASLLNEKHCHAILAGGVNTIVFSADAAVEPLYSQLRVKGDLEKVLRNIRMFNDIRRKHYPQSKIISRVSGVKFNDAQNMDEMVGLWGDLVEQVCFVTYNPSHGLDNIYESPVNEISEPCSELWRRMFIWYDGQVNPCETDYKSRLSVGNKREGSISGLWRGDEYEKLREEHRKNRSGVDPCQRCTLI